MNGIGALDLSIIAIYLAGIVGAGVWAGVRERRGAEASRYFLAGNNLTWPSIGLALFATNISCLHLVSLSQAGYDSGLLMGNFEWLAAYTLIALSLFFVPFYLRAKVSTLPDFLERRYGTECRDWLAALSMVTAIVFHIAFPLSTGWLVLHGVFGIGKWTCILTLTTLTAIYTVFGGLSAVVMTETIQAVVLLAGSFAITALAYAKAGGWQGMLAQLHAGGDTIQLSLLRSSSDEPGLPWYAVLLGYPALSIWYWCADQTIVQRVLGAKDENHARTGPLFCGLIKILPLFVFILPGLLFFTTIRGGGIDNVAQLRPRGPVAELAGARLSGVRTIPLANSGAPVDLTAYLAGSASVTLISGIDAARLMVPPNVTVLSSKETYGVMIRALMPVGLFGVMGAALMAALMSNLAGAANSIATMFSYDFYRRFRPDTSEHSLVKLGRVASVVSFALGIALVPLLDNYQSIFAGINDIIAHIAPPVSCVFAMGVFWPKASAFSAKWTMWIGSLTGALVFAGKTLWNWRPAAFAWIPRFLYSTPFMLMAFYLLCFCILLQILLTFFRPKQAWEDPQRLFWPHPLDALKSPGWPGAGNYRFLSALVFVIMTVLYVVFR